MTLNNPNRPETATPGILTIEELVDKHKTTWRDKPESYWFQRLVGEIGELGCSLAGDHEHPPEWELSQIAAICMNWIDMRRTSHATIRKERG